MRHFSCFGQNFIHTLSSCGNKIPKYFDWKFYDLNCENTFFIDDEIIRSNNYKHIKGKKFGWMLESRSSSQIAKEFIVNNLDTCYNSFECIFTSDKDLLDLSDFFKFLPAYGTSVQDFLFGEKNKKVCIITSNKTFTNYQKYRVNYVSNNKLKFDLFGVGYNPIAKKEDVLKNYFYSIAIENDAYNYYYSEKIIDCFATKTIPIYLGAPNIYPFIETGVVRLNHEMNFDFFDQDLYFEYKREIEENYKISKQFYCLEDYLYEQYKIFFM